VACGGFVWCVAWNSLYSKKKSYIYTSFAFFCRVAQFWACGVARDSV